MVVSMLALVGAASAKIKCNAMEHDVQEITKLKFDTVIGKFRDSSISSLFLFDDNTPVDMFDQYNKVATALKGMVKVTALDCDKDAEAKAFCQKESEKIPAIRIFPQNPMSAYTYEGKTEKLQNHLSKRIPDFVKILTDANFDSWITTDPSKPKVLLFTDKESCPTMFKALSSETVFRRTLNFGLVSSKQEKAFGKMMNGKTGPKILMIRGQKAEIKEWYNGKLGYEEIKTWCNLYSESGMGDAVHGVRGEETAEESRPWLAAEVPELTGKSHQDVCFKSEGLCVIYLNKGNVLDDETKDIILALKDKYTSNLSDRGTKLKWMWIDMELEKKYAELFGNPDPVSELPGVVVFNPHKRLRWTKLEGSKATEVSINALLDKILGGDAKFTVVKGGKLPTWAIRSDGTKGKKEEL